MSFSTRAKFSGGTSESPVNERIIWSRSCVCSDKVWIALPRKDIRLTERWASQSAALYRGHSIRELRIDAREVFNPEINRDSPFKNQLRLVVEQCSEQEAETVIPVVCAVLNALHDKNAIDIEK